MLGSPSCIRVHAGSHEGTYVRSLTTGTSCRKGRLARPDASRVPTGALLDLVRELSPDRVLRLLRELTHEPRRPRDEHEGAHAPRRNADVRERGAAGAGAVDRQVLAGR